MISIKHFNKCMEMHLNGYYNKMISHLCAFMLFPSLGQRKTNQITENRVITITIAHLLIYSRSFSLTSSTFFFALDFVVLVH